METTWSKVTPVVATVKSQVEEKVMPVIPSKVTETVQTVHNVAVCNISAAVEKVDNFATGGIDQLTEKVPQLKETHPSSSRIRRLLSLLISPPSQNMQQVFQ